MKQKLKSLRERWRHEEMRVDAILADIKVGKDWTIHLLHAPDGSPKPLPYIDECRYKKIGKGAAPRDLRGVVIRNADLTNTTGLADTCLDGAILHNVHLPQASLTGSSLAYCVLSGTTSLMGAEARLASLQNADCRSISFKDADLRETDLRGCDFRDADLRGTDFTGAKIKEEGAFGFLSLRRAWTKFGGVYQASSSLNPKNSARVRKHIAQSSHILDLSRRRPVLGLLSYVFANHGRSAVQFGLLTVVGFWFAFALAYRSPGTFMQRSGPKFAVSGCERPLTMSDSMYLSAVTITTLGYGDIVPAPGNGLARFLVASEAVAGVVIAGAFINMLVQNAMIEPD
jgi:hypothetical protein